MDRETLHRTRGTALADAADAIMTVADRHNVCPVCLAIALGKTIDEMSVNGRIIHFVQRHSPDDYPVQGGVQ